MIRSSRIALLGVLFVGLACGDDDDNTGPDGEGGTLTAQVDGVAFNANLGISATYSNNVLAIGGTQSTGGTDVKQINIVVNNVTAAVPYNLTSASGGVATYTETVGGSVRSWNSLLPGGGGQVVVTTLTANRVAGTFTFAAPAASQSGATGTKNANQGSFDIEIGSSGKR